jgi:putative ABC transport system permease protein
MSRSPRNGPPRWGLTIARHCAPVDRREEVEGDLMESWTRRREAGRRDLRGAFWRDVVSILTARGPARWRRRPASAPGASVLQDLRYALRLAHRQPVFTALALATLTLGIGAAITIFTISDRVLARPLPYPDPERLVTLDHVGFSFANDRLNLPESLRTSPAFSAAALYASGGLNLGDDKSPARLSAADTSAAFFRAFGVSPLAGRIFTDDDERDAATVAILSESTWRQHLGARRDAIGQTIRLNSRTFTIIGIMPGEFRFPQKTDVWVPSGADLQLSGAAFSPSVVARLAPGVSRAQAVDALERITEKRRERNPGADIDSITMTPLQEKLAGKSRPTLLLLSAVVGLLLLTTAANIAGLLLSRMRSREREMAVRAALGATRARIAQLVFTESLALTLVAGSAGLLLASWAVRVFAATVPAFAPDIDLTSFDGRLVMIALLVMAVTTILFSAIPASTAGGTAASSALRSTRAVTDRAGWLKNTLVAAQVGTALVLLTVAGTAMIAVRQLMQVDLGFHNDHAIAFELTLPNSRYTTGTSIVNFADRLVSGLSQQPGIRSAAATSRAPGSAGLGIGIGIRPAEHPDAPPLQTLLLTATPDYFAALGTPLLAGRAFTADDRVGTPPVIIVSESAARQLWGEPAAAVGRHVRARYLGNDHADVEVVGVVSDVRMYGALGRPSPQSYLPLPQQPPFGTLGVVVNAAQSPEAVLPAVRAALHAVDPDLPAYNIVFIRDVRARYLATERITLGLTTAFSLMALLLSAIGLYGVLSQLVSQRTREIGIRMALGADRAHMRRDIVLAGLRVTTAGIVVGTIAAIGASSAIAALVPTMKAVPLATVAPQAAVLLAVSILAAWVPARRASAVDPAITLRAD